MSGARESWNVAAPPSRLQSAACNRRLDFGPFLENLPSPIHAGLEIDVMRAAQLSGILVFDVGRLFEGVGGPAHAAPGRRRSSLRCSHRRHLLGAARGAGHVLLIEAGLIED